MERVLIFSIRRPPCKQYRIIRAFFKKARGNPTRFPGTFGFRGNKRSYGVWMIVVVLNAPV